MGSDQCRLVLHHAGHDPAAIAQRLNQEGWRPAKRRDSFNAAMVRHLLLRAGLITVQYRRRQPEIQRAPDEWTIRELAEQIGMPEPTLYTWVQQGRLASRQVPAGSGYRKLIHVDAATIAEMKAIRTTPPPWRRLPALLAPANDPATES